ncbi:hypothetical protein BDZ97DRAFT_1928499 [Flammula alnicola]|nr:hypothetical protein BDZ97DRAFT_1928499 [Flammula alnicola]
MLQQIQKLRVDDAKTSLLDGHAFLNLLAWAYDTKTLMARKTFLRHYSTHLGSSLLSSLSQITSASITADGIEKDDVYDSVLELSRQVAALATTSALEGLLRARFKDWMIRALRLQQFR